MAGTPIRAPTIIPAPTVEVEMPVAEIASFLIFGVYPKPLLDVVNPAVTRVLTEVGVTDPAPAVPAVASVGSEK